MKKVVKLAQQPSLEHNLRKNVELVDELRADTVNDLDSLTEDFKHMTGVVASIQQNYNALLSQNRRMKDTLLSILDECYCWEGNRCERCQKILKVVTSENVEEKPQPIQDYQGILQQLRKLG